MGKRGPLPKPTALRKAEGNVGRLPIHPDEPQPLVEKPRCPQHLSKIARRHWHMILPLLYNLGLIAKIDLSTFAAYCQNYGRWVKAERELAKEGEGEVITSKHGQSYQSPWLSISNKCLELQKHYESSFGLSPATRVRLSTSLVSTKKRKDMSDTEKSVRDILNKIDETGIPLAKRNLN